MYVFILNDHLRYHGCLWVFETYHKIPSLQKNKKN